MAEPTISAQFLRHVANCVELTGHSSNGLLEQIAVTREMLEDPEGLIPLAHFLAFFEEAAALVRNPHFGLHAGRLAGSDSIGPLSFLFLSAPDLRTAFASFSRYLSTFQQASRHQFTDEGKRATFAYGLVDQSLSRRRQDAEYSIGAMVSLARQFTGGEIEFSEVRFEHERVGDYARYRDYFGCDVFFEQDCNALTIEARYLDLRGRVLSPALHPILDEHLRRLAGREGNDSLADAVKALIEAAPLDTPPPLAEVAARLDLSVPTLHRRLAAEGSGWRALVSAHRMETAARLLRTSRRNVSAIALDVGFAESASFTRAFARHFGVSPGRYRKGEVTPQK
ncbi:AraC family transcriptional regulator [Novosphingobium sp.]|uniref:AraC family transcriptional regulator n=1 Tax=Novosphingobium sp. TaxID=1874826 RepID=UPI001D4F5C34|nr:AraC family transcriptional regulator [Novosphingobium sp.]MBX9662066.1 AraC family transcriptional regulator [Novosphingobium sp.]